MSNRYGIWFLLGWQPPKAGDIEKVLSLMSDDVVFLIPGQPVMRKAGFAAAARAQAGKDAAKFYGTSEIQ